MTSLRKLMTTIAAIAAVYLMSTTGCATDDCLPAGSIQPTLENILADHEAFVNGTKDPATLAEVEKEIILGDVAIVRAAVKKAVALGSSGGG